MKDFYRELYDSMFKEARNSEITEKSFEFSKLPSLNENGMFLQKKRKIEKVNNPSQPSNGTPKIEAENDNTILQHPVSLSQSPSTQNVFQSQFPSEMSQYEYFFKQLNMNNNPNLLSFSQNNHEMNQFINFFKIFASSFQLPCLFNLNLDKPFTNQGFLLGRFY